VITILRASIAICACLLLMQTLPEKASNNQWPISEVDEVLNEMFAERTRYLINQKPDKIISFYLPHSLSSQMAFEKQIKRSMYVNAWFHLRGMVLLDATSEIEIVRQRLDGTSANIQLFDTIQFKYVSKYQLFPINSLAIRTKHNIALRKENGDWRIKRESYTDPIANDPARIPRQPVLYNVSAQLSSPNRKQAAWYANEYAGTNTGYNSKYQDYERWGGDCTNYVSQVLGDDKAGALPMSHLWHYTNGQGTKSWSETDSFYQYLLKTRYARLLAKGSFTEITKQTGDQPYGIVSELQTGDLIAYEEKGDIVHFSVVIGKDSSGYPLVNSHSADRYHVPWDMGWDGSTRFHLIQINYETSKKYKKHVGAPHAFNPAVPWRQP
jgi:hypothetical protein